MQMDVEPSIALFLIACVLRVNRNDLSLQKWILYDWTAKKFLKNYGFSPMAIRLRDGSKKRAGITGVDRYALTSSPAEVTWEP